VTESAPGGYDEWVRWWRRTHPGEPLPSWSRGSLEDKAAAGLLPWLACPWPR